jgi:hypothetical protein
LGLFYDIREFRGLVLATGREWHVCASRHSLESISWKCLETTLQGVQEDIASCALS